MKTKSMEACLAVEKEIDKVLTKFGAISESSTRIINDLMVHIQAIKAELENAPDNHILTTIQLDIVQQAMSKVKDTVARLTTDHRELHSTVSKVGKAIDRNFVADFAMARTREEPFSAQDKIDLINKVICQHMYRQGMPEVVQALCAEAKINTDDIEEPSFVELNCILDSIKRHDIEPALAWATCHGDQLQALNSSLEFQLHRLKYIDLLQQQECRDENNRSDTSNSNSNNRQQEAINYARVHFRKFVKRHEKDIQSLMGMLLYIPQGLKRSPYHGQLLLGPEMWIDIYENFLVDACRLMGVSVNSPLATCIDSGCLAVPALISLNQVMQQRKVGGIWNGKDELPIEIDLGNEARYHSMFACPILRQQASQNNPPMKLICGHVISRDALNKLCNGNKKSSTIGLSDTALMDMVVSNLQQQRALTEQLRREAALKRMPVSLAVADIVKYISEHEQEDCLLVGFSSQRVNPYREKTPCTLL